MAERSREEKYSGHRIYIGAKGHRYVKAEELLKDQEVKIRLHSAARLASKLGLKGKPDSPS